MPRGWRVCGPFRTHVPAAQRRPCMLVHVRLGPGGQGCTDRTELWEHPCRRVPTAANCVVSGSGPGRDRDPSGVGRLRATDITHATPGTACAQADGAVGGDDLCLCQLVLTKARERHLDLLLCRGPGGNSNVRPTRSFCTPNEFDDWAKTSKEKLTFHVGQRLISRSGIVGQTGIRCCSVLWPCSGPVWNTSRAATRPRRSNRVRAVGPPASHVRTRADGIPGTRAEPVAVRLGAVSVRSTVCEDERPSWLRRCERRPGRARCRFDGHAAELLGTVFP